MAQMSPLNLRTFLSVFTYSLWCSVFTSLRILEDPWESSYRYLALKSLLYARPKCYREFNFLIDRCASMNPSDAGSIPVSLVTSLLLLLLLLSRSLRHLVKHFGKQFGGGGLERSRSSGTVIPPGGTSGGRDFCLHHMPLSSYFIARLLCDWFPHRFVQANGSLTLLPWYTAECFASNREVTQRQMLALIVRIGEHWTQIFAELGSRVY